MRRTLLTCLTALLLCLPMVGHAGELTGRWTHGTDAFICDGVQRNIDWGTDDFYPNPIYIRAVHIWMGMAKGSISDFAPYLKLLKGGVDTGNVIAWTNWDHYADPTQPDHALNRRFAPDYFKLRTYTGTGDLLRLTYACSNLLNSNAQGHVIADIQFLTENPDLVAWTPRTLAPIAGGVLLGGIGVGMVWMRRRRREDTP